MPRVADSASLHLLMGNPNNKTKKELYSRKKNEEKLTVGSDKIDAPDWLAPTARRHFNRIKEVLADTGLLTNADVDLITAYAVTLADFQSIEGKINATARYTRTKQDGPKVNGLMREKRNIIAQLVKLQNELALTPRARASLAIAMGDNKGDEDDHDEFD